MPPAFRPFLLALSAAFLLSGTALGIGFRSSAQVVVASGVRLRDFEGKGRDTALRALTQQLYARYRDDADFLLLVANRTTIPASTPDLGYHFRVANTVAGLGVPKFNAGANFGQTNTLQGILYFPRWTLFWRSPLLHELAHGWANDALPTAERGHFGFCGAGSQLGGFDMRTLKALGGGLYQAKNRAGRPFGTATNGNDVPYSDFELYLMGLLPANEVRPFACAVGASWVSPAQGIFRAQQMQTLTIADVQRRLGPRLPDARTAPKTFRVLAVLLSEGEPTLAQVRGAERAVTQIAVQDNHDSTYTFFEATRGRGRLLLLRPKLLEK